MHIGYRSPGRRVLTSADLELYGVEPFEGELVWDNTVDPNCSIEVTEDMGLLLMSLSGNFYNIHEANLPDEPEALKPIQPFICSVCRSEGFTEEDIEGEGDDD